MNLHSQPPAGKDQFALDRNPSISENDGVESNVSLVSTQRHTGQFWQHPGMPYLALVLQGAVVLVLAVTTTVPAWITYPHQFSFTNQTVYNLGVVILAAGLSAYTVVQVRLLWPRRPSKRAKTTSTAHVHVTQVFIEPLSWRDEFIGLPFFLVTLSSLLMLALVFYGVSGGLAASPVDIHLTYDAHLFDANVSDSDCWLLSTALQADEIGWRLNQTHYMVANSNSTSPICPRALAAVAHDAMPPSQRSWWPSFYSARNGNCMRVFGGDVYCSAAGTPIDPNRSCGIRGAFGCSQNPGPFDVPYSRLSVCAPVLVQSPVRCRAAASLSIPEIATSSARHSIDGCEIGGTNRTGKLTFQQSDKNAFGACLDPHGPLGHAKLTIWSSEKRTFARPGCDPHDYGGMLALKRLMYPDDLDGQDKALSVSCDIAPSGTAYQYQIVHFGEDRVGDTWSHLTSNGIACDPRRGTANSVALDMSPTMAATATITLLHLLSSNLTLPEHLETFVDGSNQYFDSLGPGWNNAGIPDSENTLEELLSSLLAYGLALYHGQPEESRTNSSDLSRLYHVNYTATALRVGPGGGMAIVYALPSLLSIATLVHLLHRKQKQDSSDGDESSVSLAKQKFT